ncbi:Syndecan [Aphelenchoides besseyi]|nr:Syndecan [Aphelenchoides besseyi]KAI6209434.1 Syndecan [Aphelenchoides besseyi]
MLFAQNPRICRLLTVGFIFIVFTVNRVDAKIDGPAARPPSTAPSTLVEGSGIPVRTGGNIDDEVIRASGNSNNPDDDDSEPEINGSGLPPKTQSQTPTVRSTTTTTTKAPTTKGGYELNLSEQNELDDEDEYENDQDDDEEDEELPSEIATTTSLSTTQSTTTRAPITSQPALTTTWRPPVQTTKRPPYVSVQEESIGLDMLKPGLLAAISGGAVVGLLLTILLVMFVVYRMRKKDEGSYALDEGTHQPASYSYAYQKAPTKEFYA